MRSRSTDFASCSIGFYTNTTHFLIVVSTRSNTRLSMCTWQGKEGWRSNECLEWLKLTLSSQIYTTKLYIYVCVCMMYVCCVCMHARVYIYICIYIHIYIYFSFRPAEFIFVHSTWRVSLITFKREFKGKSAGKWLESFRSYIDKDSER